MKMMEEEKEEGEETAGYLLCPLCTLYSTTFQPVVFAALASLDWDLQQKAAPSEIMA